MSTLQVTWGILIGLILTVYLILDGFDLGVGFWHLFTKRDSDRRSMLNAIMPYWDGNEVWLLTGGGAVFAAFPAVYATVLSGFYLAIMMLLFGLIFRAVSIEFRNQSESMRWRAAWDTAFAVGSIISGLLFGVAAGNILRGLPLDAKGNYVGTFLDLLNPYALLIGVSGLAMFALHGAIFAALKTEGELSTRAVSWARGTAWVYLALLIISIVVTAVTQRTFIANYLAMPVLWALPTIAVASVVTVGIFSTKSAMWQAFVASSIGILAAMASLGAGLFPNMVPALNNPAYSLTLANASSSPLTLKTMLILALVGMPIVIAYTSWAHLAFRGKISEEGYY